MDLDDYSDPGATSSTPANVNATKENKHGRSNKDKVKKHDKKKHKQNTKIKNTRTRIAT